MKKTNILYSIILAGGLLSGCANPGIVQLSPDTYMLSRVDHAGMFGNASALKAGVISDADAFAASQGKVAVVIAANDSPAYPGHFATFEYQFRVVDKNDPDARRTSLAPRPKVVIEKDEKITGNIRTSDEPEKHPDLYTEILKLDELRKKGLITDAEYEAQKQKYLAEAK
jgi:hypothetical protein